MYRILANADEGDSVDESDEENNQIWQDVYVGFADRLALDSGGATDQAYTQENGFGYLESSTQANSFCGNAPEETQRKDNDGDITYRFDHLLIGHFYHLDITFMECDGLGRQQSITVDNSQIGSSIDLSDGQLHQVSILLDPALYADRSIDVSIDELMGYDATISVINLVDVDYRYADSGGENDPQYPSNTMLEYGWLDGVANTAWGILPHQSRRIDLIDSDPSNDPDNELRYQFDGLVADKFYNLLLVFNQYSGGAITQTILVDEEQVDTVVLNSEQREDIEVVIPNAAYALDGSITVMIRREGALAGAFVNEISLEEITLVNNMTVVQSILRTDANPSNATSVDFTITFSEAVEGVDITDFNLITTGVSDASVSSVFDTGDQRSYTVTVNTGTGSGTIRLDVKSSDTGIQDGDNNPLSGGYTSGEIYAIDKTAPNTTIDSKPTNPSNSTSASFDFSSTDNTAAFECKLDSEEYVACTSTKVYTSLNTGSHTFYVRAVDLVNNKDASPASYTWSIDTTAPDTTIDSKPADPSNSASASFEFSSTDGTATFECKLDSGEYVACASTETYASLSAGTHTFDVRAIDPAGNTDASPASYTWMIDTTTLAVMASVRADANPTNALSVDFTVTFSKAVTGVDKGDFNLITTGVITGTSITAVVDTGDQTSYTVTVNSGSGDGTIRLDVKSSGTGIQDLASNPLSGGYTSGESYTISKSPTFSDVPTPGKEWMQPWIEQFYNAEITGGCGYDSQNNLMYCPEREVTRAEMAVFNLRAMHYPQLPYTPPAGGGTFIDVPVVSKEWMEPWIEDFYQNGITSGCGYDQQGRLLYCPERQVTRAEMAVFVLRSTQGASWTPPAASGTFIDVPIAGKEWMEPWVEAFYTEGITSGCGTDGNGNLMYCPERAVTRAEMAVFLLRAFDQIPAP